MPMPIAQGQAQTAGGSDKVAKLNAEVTRLRKEVSSLRGQLSGEGSRSSVLGWITMALAACGTLLGLIALFRG